MSSSTPRPVPFVRSTRPAAVTVITSSSARSQSPSTMDCSPLRKPSGTSLARCSKEGGGPMTLYITPSNEEPPHESNSTRTNQRAFASPLAREDHPPSLHTTFSTVWMPLEGLIQQWAQFGTEASTALELHATSTAFAALACEREAL